jgi:hypothetical protein
MTYLLTPARIAHDVQKQSEIIPQRVCNDSYAATGTMVVITAASKSYLDRLENLVGSIHYHHPCKRTKILVYDIGLRNWQRQKISTWDLTFVRDISGSDFNLISDVRTYAFKAVIINDALQVEQSVM